MKKEDDAPCDDDRGIPDQQRPLGLVRRGVGADGVSGLRHDAVPVAAPSTVSGSGTVTSVPCFHTRIFEGRSWGGRIGDKFLLTGHR